MHAHTHVHPQVVARPHALLAECLGLSGQANVPMSTLGDAEQKGEGA